MMMNLNDQTLALLHVSRGNTSSTASGRIEVDEYVPLRCRTYDEPLGVGYLRLGNYSTSLIELAVEPRTQVLRGVTITSIDEVSPWPEFEVIDSVDQLPVVSTTFEGGEVVDLQDEFKISARPHEVIVFWGDIARCTAYQCGSASFLVVNHILVGVWCTGLTEEETKLFVSHVGGM